MEKFHVLIIEDDKDLAGHYTEMLKTGNFSSEVVSTGKDALVRLNVAAPDMVLLDMDLGYEVGGEDILYQIRSNPAFDRTRVIIITAYPAIAEMVSDLADLVLVKPIENEQFKALLARVANYDIETKEHPFRDPVTLLFTHEFFRTRLELALGRTKRRKEFLFAMLVFDIGVSGSDTERIPAATTHAVLAEIADRLKRNLRPVDTIARISSWRFATLHEDLKQAEDLSIIQDRLSAVLADSIRIGGEEYFATVVFGSVVYQANFQVPEELFEIAEKDLSEKISQRDS